MTILSNIGLSLLFITFLVSLYGIFAAVYGARRNAVVWVDSARNAMLLTFPLLTLVVFSLVLLLTGGDFQVAYVYSVTSRAMPLYLKITALWGGQAGSLLFWSWLLSAFIAAVTLRRWGSSHAGRDREFLPWVIVVGLITLAFFLLLSNFIENPFERYWQTPAGEMTALFQPKGALPLIPMDGYGMNPLLRHPGMVLHPPLQYLGFVAFVVPYAFAMAALITGRTDDRWLRITRRWTLFAWLFLSLGLVLGSWWAYQVLGWGGYWGWDPVETSALMPWLTGTAFLHSLMIQERRGLFKRWNIILITLTYSLVILGTFLTRSGVLSSVHAFAQSAIGPLFFAFISISFVVSLSLLLYRWNDLRAEGQVNSILSREALFLFNNLLFMGILAVCLWGVTYPLISELLTGQKVTVGPPFYERASGPLWGGLLFLMGIAPLSAWGKSTLATLGRGMWKPLAASLVVVVLVLVLEVRNPLAVLAFWLSGLTFFITLFQYLRGVSVRSRIAGEPWLTALWRVGGRNRRRYGGYIIHLAMVLMGLGIIGIEMFQSETQGALNRDESLRLDRYTVQFKSLRVFDTEDGRNVAQAVMHVYRDGRFLDEYKPRREYYYDAQQQVTIPSIRSTLEDDLYIILADWQPMTATNATFKIYHNPLVKWLWIGTYLFIFGMVVALLPREGTERQRGDEG